MQQHFCVLWCNEYRFNFSAGLFVQMMSLRGAHVSIQAPQMAWPKSSQEEQAARCRSLELLALGQAQLLSAKELALAAAID